MIEREQIKVGAHVWADLERGEITSVSASGLVTVRWGFGVSFLYAYNPETKRLDVTTERRAPRGPGEAP